MMGGKDWDEWIDEYSESHTHPINKLTHTLGIPLIALGGGKLSLDRLFKIP